MKKYFLILLMPFIISCAHCSKTVTDFYGKTKGFNPYGDGEVTIKRTSYWGNLECILKLIGGEDEEAEDSKSIYPRDR